MLTGSEVGLRARHEDDIPILQAELHDDVVNFSRAAGGPWRPITPGSKNAQFVVDDTAQENVPFSVVELDGGTLVGSAVLWGIDTYNRTAHIGLGLRPSARGKGFGADVVAVLCHYGFVVCGLHRLQIETLSDNAAMLRAAERNGFVREGVLRSSAWVVGEFLDEVLLGLLAEDWKPPPGGLLMHEEPVDLIRLEGEGNSVVLRVTGREERKGPDETDVLVGEFRVDTPFVRGSLETWLCPEDLRQWQQALDMLDTGHDIAWREGTRDAWLYVELGEGDDRCRVTIRDHSMSLTSVTATLPLTDAWFDDAYHRLDLTRETWPLREAST